MTFKPANGVVDIRTWSPRYSRYLTDANNQFTIQNFPFRQGQPRVRRWITNSTVYAAWRLSSNDVWYLPVAQMDKYPDGANISAAPRLIRVPGTAAIYVDDGGVKRHIVNARSLKAWRWSSADVVAVTQAQLDAMATGPTWPDYPYVVRGSGTVPIYLLDVQN